MRDRINELWIDPWPAMPWDECFEPRCQFGASYRPAACHLSAVTAEETNLRSIKKL